ncbi:hypothetical protein Sango_1869900 [Sesamum angolense]|uniref:Uncharacterized protein n=1 Tax=Sesamum angolense TaxID=2727404 RepID=A0AAE1WIT9_9LAMI|nr:hypothetical protein Sango_1869900 [Sesamum angolense]
MQGFMAEYYNWTSQGEDVVQDYFEAPRVPQVSEEQTPAGHVEGILDDGMKSCPVDVGTSSYVYSSDGPYDYDESGLADCFSNVVHAADQPLWEEYPNRLIEYFPLITLSRDYYSTKKLVKNLGLPVEKIHACKNGCMLYWKDDVDLEYCKFCGDGRFLTGGTATMRACSSSSSRRLGSSYGSGLPTLATSWPDRCGWLRRFDANFWSSGQAQNSRHSRLRIRSIGQSIQKQQ